MHGFCYTSLSLTPCGSRHSLAAYFGLYLSEIWCRYCNPRPEEIRRTSPKGLLEFRGEVSCKLPFEFPSNVAWGSNMQDIFCFSILFFFHRGSRSTHRRLICKHFLLWREIENTSSRGAGCPKGRAIQQSPGFESCFSGPEWGCLIGPCEAAWRCFFLLLPLYM